MRISDWSSDVCSSDLLSDPAVAHREYHAVLVAVRLAFASHRIALEFDDDTRIFGGDGFDLRTQPGRQQLLERVDGADDGVVTANAGELAEALGVGERLRMQERDCRGDIAAAHRFDETKHELLVVFCDWRCSCGG